jgi:hypothetical protein
MDPLFLGRVMLSFFIAGTWIACVTWFAERFGSKIGGLFSNLPSNILISLIFIALQHDVNFVRHMVPAIPIGMLIDTVFLVLFMALIRHGLPVTLFVSLSAWFILASAASLFPVTSLITSTIIYIIFAALLYLVTQKFMVIPPVPGSDKRYTVLQLSARALFAGGIVATVVLVSGFVPPYFVGIVSTFPAVLLSTMVILVKNQGAVFARATGKVLIISSSNIIVYGICVYYTFPALGILWGTVSSFFISVLWILFLNKVMEISISKESV